MVPDEEAGQFDLPLYDYSPLAALQDLCMLALRQFFPPGNCPEGFLNLIQDFVLFEITNNYEKCICRVVKQPVMCFYVFKCKTFYILLPTDTGQW